MILGKSKGTQQVTSGEMPPWDILERFCISMRMPRVGPER